MPTVFFLGHDTAPGTSDTGLDVTPSSWSAGWNKTAFAVTHFATTYPRGAEIALTSPSPSLSGTSGHFTALARYVSPRLSAQTISGTLRGKILGRANAGTDVNLTVAIAAKVITSAGADRGVLLAVSASDASTSPPRFTEGSLNIGRRSFQDSSENTDLTLSSVDAQDGDYIVIEIGVRQSSTLTDTDYDLALGAGTNTLVSGADGNIGTLVPPIMADSTPWVEFSGDIIFAPYLFGSASTPTDGAAATGTADPTAVTPPSNMVQGDLVVMIGHQRAAGATLAVSATGGQTWNTEAAIGTTNVTARVFWCIYNGTWSADPSVDFSATTCNSVQMHVFRGVNRFTYPDKFTWAVNQAQVELDIAAAATQTITGQTTTGSDPTVTLAGWFTADDNSWGNLSGTGWAVAGSAQYRNTSGSDQSSTYAYKIQTTAGATGNVSKGQTANGNDAATSFIITFAEVPLRKQAPVDRSYAVTRAALH